MLDTGENCKSLALILKLRWLNFLRQAMSFLTKRSASERLVTFLKKDCEIFNDVIDADHFLARIEQVGALIAIREFLHQAEVGKKKLLPGYWRFFYRLKKKLENHK